jgi:hypothetical protein
MVSRWLTRGAVVLGCLGFVAYAGDFISVRYAIPKNRAVYGSVQVNKYLAVPLKNGKDEYDFVGSEDMVCTKSLFPQLGYTPCWWLRRHRERREEL